MSLYLHLGNIIHVLSIYRVLSVWTVINMPNIGINIQASCKGGSGGCLVPHTSEYDVIVFLCTVGNV